MTFPDRMRVFFLCLALILVSQVPVSAVDSFVFRQYEDTAFLPYRVKVLREIRTNPNARRAGSFFQVWRPRYDDTSKAFFVGLNLPKTWEDQTFTIDVLSFPPITLLQQTAIRMTPAVMTCYRDTVRGENAVLVAGFYSDSASIVRYDPTTSTYIRRFLQTGKDGTGDGRWEPEIVIPMVDDYDYDGQVEVFVYVKPVRDKGIRTLYCLELETLRIEWSLPVASGLRGVSDIYRLSNTSDPGVIFIARGPRQGKIDSNYNDLFKYCSVIDDSGQIRSNRIIQFDAFPVGITPDETGAHYYMFHEFGPVDASRVDSLVEEVEHGTISRGTCMLSVLDDRGNVTRTKPVSSQIQSIWLMAYEGSEQKYLFAYSYDRCIRVYDSMLTLVAMTEPIAAYPGWYVGPMRLEASTDAYVFSDGIYSQSLEQLARFDARYVVQPLAYDQNGAAKQLLLRNSETSLIVQIERRGWWTVLTVVYFRYKIYIMVAVTALLVGLLVTNHYRARTRKNLITIREQKTQLEQAQQALREAQAQLVAQEKFRQARDIAGGFAHEIRNALSPVRNALTVIARMDPERLERGQLARSRLLIDRCVSQAIQLTRRISEYAHLERPAEAVPVNLGEVIEAAIARHRDSLDERKIKTTIPEAFPGPVLGDRTQYEIVFSNLIGNASDALTDTVDPKIRVTCHQDDETVTVEVSDNGAGIPDGNIDRIFDFFYSTKPNTGTGVGLAIVKKTIEMYGGSVTVESSPESGTVFGLVFLKSQA